MSDSFSFLRGETATELANAAQFISVLIAALAWLMARGARKAAQEAKAAINLKSLIEELHSIKAETRVVQIYSQQDEWGAASLLAESVLTKMTSLGADLSDGERNVLYSEWESITKALEGAKSRKAMSGPQRTQLMAALRDFTRTISMHVAKRSAALDTDLKKEIT